MRILASLSFSVAVAVSLACGGTGTNKAAQPEQEPIEFEDMPAPKVDPTQPVKAAHLKIVPVTIKLEGQEVSIDAEGKVLAQGNHLGTINPAGEFNAANGGLFGTLNEDGSMTKAHVNLDRFVGIHISETGVLTKANDAGEHVAANEISETGEVSENGVVGLTIDGPPEGRRAAMFVYLVLAGSSLDAQEKAAGGGTAPAPAPKPDAGN